MRNCYWWDLLEEEIVYLHRCLCYENPSKEAYREEDLESITY